MEFHDLLLTFWSISIVMSVIFFVFGSLIRDIKDFIKYNRKCKVNVLIVGENCLEAFCPLCGERLSSCFEENYCFKCGQALKWPDCKEDES